MSEGDNTRLCPLKIIIFATCLTGGQPNKYRTSTEQVQDKYPTSTRQVEDLLHTGDPNIMSLIMAIGDSQLSVKEMMSAAELKNRENFMDNYLNPAIENGYVRLLYPNSPRHPRQKYLLTVKGLTLYYDSLNSLEE